MAHKAHKLVPLNPPQILEALRDDFDLDLRGAEQITSGFSSQVYKSQLDGKDVFIRINHRATVFPVEMIGYELFKEKGIPGPSILYYQEKPENIRYPTVIMSAAEGVALNELKPSLSPRELSSIYKEAGGFMRKMHEIHLRGWGPLRIEDECLVGKFATHNEYWESLATRQKEDSEYLRQYQLLTKRELDALEAVERELREITVSNPSLLHRDVHSMHIFIQDGGISGIIDLGRLLSGDPRYDIAMSLMYLKTQAEQESFQEGYGKLASDPIVSKYLLSIAAGKLAWRSQNGLADTVDIAQRVFREALRKIKQGG